MKPKPSTPSKSHTNTKKAPIAKPTQQLTVEKSPSSGSWFGFLFKPYNLLFGFIAILFLVWCNKNVTSYNWVYNNLLKGGYKYCGMVQEEINNRTRGISDLALKRQIAYDTKYEAKIGTEFMILKMIRDKTPPNAIILFPPPLILTQKTTNLNLKYEIGMKSWASHFLYPRTIVYEQEKGKNPFYEKAQYIFVLHGWGFDHLNYEPQQRNQVDILPLHKS
ncbi:MAG: hypothetical protein NTY32_00755 [Bacteroidia bacterium]|nr:hypothetical protein [Bacteroidia bacterium]